MLTEVQTELLGDMKACLDDINRAIARVKQDASERDTYPEMMRYINGDPILAPLLVQKAQLMYEISDMESQDMESEDMESQDMESEDNDCIQDEEEKVDPTFNLINWGDIARQQRQARTHNLYIDDVHVGDMLEPETLQHKLWRMANPSPNVEVQTRRAVETKLSWLNGRKHDLKRAMMDCAENGDHIPQHWVDEYNDLVSQIQRG